jgi:hypothetical protein
MACKARLPLSTSSAGADPRNRVLDAPRFPTSLHSFVHRPRPTSRSQTWVGARVSGDEMKPSRLMFFGFEIELVVDAVLNRDDRGTRLCSAHDRTAQQWLIVKVNDEPDDLAWLCVPVSERAIEAILTGRGSLRDAIRHSATGTVDLVRVEHGRAMPDRCLLCPSIPEHLLPPSNLAELVAA